MTPEELIEPDTLILAGDASKSISIAPHSLSTITLLTALRESDKTPVLVPYVEMSLHFIHQKELQEGLTPQELTDGEPTLTRTVGLENALWLTFDILRDLANATGHLADTAPNGLKLDISRLQLAKLFAEQARMAATNCALQLEQLLDAAQRVQSEASAASEGQQPEQHTPRPRPKGPRKRLAKG